MLSTSARTAVDAALEQLRLATERQEVLAVDVSTGLTGLWNRYALDDAGAQGLRNNAATSRRIYEEKRRMAADLADDAAAAQFVRDLSAFVDTRAIEATANFLQPSTALVEVGKGTAKDLADVAQGVGGGFLSLLKASPLIIGAVLVLWLWTWLPKRSRP